MDDHDRTASLMTPAKLAQVTKPKGPVSPAAWLDQMAADAGHPHVQRLAELRKELEARAPRPDISAASAALASLGEALPKLDFGLLQARGWWARTSGKSRTAGAEFSRQFEQIEEEAKAAVVQSQALQKLHQEQSISTERTLLEIEVEYRALDKIIDQGARWLQDMRNQLKTRQAAGTDAAGAQQIKDDAARCEILVARLKLLRAVSSAALHSHQQGQAGLARRAALLQVMQQTASHVKTWINRISRLASVAGDSNSPALSVEEPMETHRELQLSVKQALTDCGQLRVQETGLHESLAALAAQLDAAKS